MENNEQFDLNTLLDSATDAPEVASAPVEPVRPRNQFLRKIPVTVTLEVGSAQVSLYDLMALSPSSVIELDKIAGEPLDLKVNNTRVGRAEVVVVGENYGLRIIEIDHLDLDSFVS